MEVWWCSDIILHVVKVLKTPYVSPSYPPPPHHDHYTWPSWWLYIISITNPHYFDTTAIILHHMVHQGCIFPLTTLSRSPKACSILHTCHTLSKWHTAMPADTSAAQQPHEPQNTPMCPTATNPNSVWRPEMPGGQWVVLWDMYSSQCCWHGDQDCQQLLHICAAQLRLRIYRCDATYIRCDDSS